MLHVILCGKASSAGLIRRAICLPFVMCCLSALELLITIPPFITLSILYMYMMDADNCTKGPTEARDDILLN